MNEKTIICSPLADLHKMFLLFLLIVVTSAQPRKVLEFIRTKNACAGQPGAIYEGILHTRRHEEAVHATGGKCPTEHNNAIICKDCQNFAYLGIGVRKLMNAVANCLGREHNDAGIYARNATEGPVAEILTMATPITFCSQSLNVYHRHVVRGVVMNRAIAKVMDELPVGQILIILDHKQKIQSINFNESTEDYYGKKGTSLLGFLVRWRTHTGEDLHTRYIDVVSDNGTQDAFQVQALLNVTLPSIKELVPFATEFILVSDNGSAFSGGSNLQFCFRRNKLQWNCNLVLVRWLYFEAQCGKTTLDTHFSFVNIVLRRFARETREVKTSEDVFDALKANGGIANSLAMLAEFDQSSNLVKQVNKAAEKGQKIEQVRRIHDVHFLDNKVRTYHYAGIEKGCQDHIFPLTNEEYESPARIKDKAIGSKIVEAKKTIVDAASVSSSVALSAGSSVRPHHLRIGEALIDFAARPNQTTLPLLPCPSVANQVEKPVSSSSKKKKDSSSSSTLPENDLPVFLSDSAKAVIRPRIEMPDRFIKEVKKMVSE